MTILSVHRDGPEPYAVVEMDEEPFVTIREYWTATYIPYNEQPGVVLGRTATFEEAREMASAHRARYNSGHGLRPEDWDDGDIACFKDPHREGLSQYVVDRHEIPGEPEPKPPMSLAEAAEEFREARTRAHEATTLLRDAVLRELAAGHPEAAVARTAGVDRMTVRRWAGKIPKGDAE